MKDDEKILGAKCPRCEGRLILRENHKRKTHFWGCTHYPQCKYAKTVTNDVAEWLKKDQAQMELFNK